MQQAGGMMAGGVVVEIQRRQLDGGVGRAEHEGRHALLHEPPLQLLRGQHEDAAEDRVLADEGLQLALVLTEVALRTHKHLALEAVLREVVAQLHDHLEGDVGDAVHPLRGDDAEHLRLGAVRRGRAARDDAALAAAHREQALLLKELEGRAQRGPAHVQLLAQDALARQPVLPDALGDAGLDCLGGFGDERVAFGDVQHGGKLWRSATAAPLLAAGQHI
ncbi:MAG TPA: hypothetical protein PKY38_13815 [Opitutaceae bacterium]|nr:hypothetical protein [Opitutaceae bacterium]